MNIWTKLTRWGSQIEKAPKTVLIRVLMLFFSGSLVIGVFISLGIHAWQAKAYDETVHDIQLTEIKSMDARLEQLTKIRYGSVQK